MTQSKMFSRLVSVLALGGVAAAILQVALASGPSIYAG